MRKQISLARYVKIRTGVALGGKGSLSAMLKRSLGAGSFSGFWHYWNPIWSYYLSRYIARPLKTLVPRWLCILLTFAVSGLLHDVAVSLLKVTISLIITPWFTLIGVVVILTDAFNIQYKGLSLIGRAFINISLVMICYLVIKLVGFYI